MYRTVLVAVVLSTVLAGCTGVSAPDSPAGNRTDASGPPPGVGEASVNTTRLVAAHEATLSNRSFRLSVTATSANRTVRRDRWVAPGGSPRLSHRGRNGRTWVTYRADGREYVRIPFERGPTYAVDEVDAEPGTGTAALTGARLVNGTMSKAAFHRDGTVERNGTRLWVLVAGIDDLRADAAENVSRFSARALVHGDGVVRSLDVEVKTSRAGGAHTFDLSVSVWDVGRTTVPRPDWLDRARDADSPEGDRDPDAVETRTVDRPDLGATVRVTGTRRALSTVEIRDGNESVWFLQDGDPLAGMRASPYVLVEADGRIEDATVTLAYDESMVPDGDESGLALFVYNRTVQTFLKMDSTVEVDGNTVTASRIEPTTAYVGTGADRRTVRPRLEDLPERSVFVVMHAESWAESWEDRSTGAARPADDPDHSVAFVESNTDLGASVGITGTGDTIPAGMALANATARVDGSARLAAARASTAVGLGNDERIATSAIETAEVTLAYDEARAPDDEDRLALYVYDPAADALVRLASTVDARENLVTAHPDSVPAGGAFVVLDPAALAE